MRGAAFTLAEVLITLGIIGIVSALTMPTLIQKYNEYVTVKKVKLAYSILNQTYTRAVKDYGGDISTWGCSTNFVACETDIFAKYLNFTSKTYGVQKTYYALNKQTLGTFYRNIINLPNGMQISFPYIFDRWNACTTFQNWTGVAEIEKYACKIIWVDINGDKEPNALGRDIFPFKIHKTKIEGLGNQTEPYYSFERMCNPDSSVANWDGRLIGEYCTAWVLYNENMDYLHCINKLGWNKAKSCK